MAWETVSGIAALISIYKNVRNVPRVVRRWALRQLAGNSEPALSIENHSVPFDTIRAVPRYPPFWWHMGSRDNAPLMQVCAQWYVTNIASVSLRVLACDCTPSNHDAIYSGIATTANPRSGMHSVGFAIPPNETVEITTDFYIQPPVLDSGEEMTATITLIDQFGNQHEIRNVTFSYS